MMIAHALFVVLLVLTLLKQSTAENISEFSSRCKHQPKFLWPFGSSQLVVGKPKVYDLKDPIIKQGMVSIALINLPSRFKQSEVYVYVTKASTNPSLNPKNLDLTVQVIQRGKGKQSQNAQCQMSFYFPSSGIKLLRYSCMPISSK